VSQPGAPLPGLIATSALAMFLSDLILIESEDACRYRMEAIYHVEEIMATGSGKGKTERKVGSSSGTKRATLTTKRSAKTSTKKQGEARTKTSGGAGRKATIEKKDTRQIASTSHKISVKGNAGKNQAPEIAGVKVVLTESPKTYARERESRVLVEPSLPTKLGADRIRDAVRAAFEKR
jgi:hypothetical protein